MVHRSVTAAAGAPFAVPALSVRSSVQCAAVRAALKVPLHFMICYNGTRVSVDPVPFAECSEYFAAHYDPNVGSISFTSRVPLELFLEFLPFAQGEPIEIKRDDVYSLLQFANEWGIASLRERIKECTNSVDEMLQRMFDNLQNNQPIDNMIDIMGLWVNTLLTKPKFGLLPLKIMKKILISPCSKIASQHTLLNFILGLCQYVGIKSSILLDVVDPSELSDNDLNSIFENKYVDIGKSPIFVSGLAQHCFSKFNEIKKINSETLKSYKTQINKKNSEIQNLKNTIRELEKDATKSQETQPPAKKPKKKNQRNNARFYYEAHDN